MDARNKLSVPMESKQTIVENVRVAKFIWSVVEWETGRLPFRRLLIKCLLF